MTRTWSGHVTLRTADRDVESPVTVQAAWPESAVNRAVRRVLTGAGVRERDVFEVTVTLSQEGA